MRSESNVLYVGGMGRSGSTLLERALAQFPNACGIGESVFLWERGLVDDDLCGCGEPFSQCPFWTAVGERAFNGWENVDPQRLAALRLRVDDVKFVPRLMLPLRLGGLGESVQEYNSYYESLYEAVRYVSGCTVVVDSSKLTALAYILSHSSGVTLRLLHMVRDPRAVAFAWTKTVRRPEVSNGQAYMPRYSPGYMSLLYCGHNVLLRLLGLRGVPTTRVRYEDFVDDPAQVLGRAQSFAGMSGEVSDVVEGTSPPRLRFDQVHTVAGNPSRFNHGDVDVRRDDKWRRQMPKMQQYLVTLLTWPVMLWLRYPTKPRVSE